MRTNTLSITLCALLFSTAAFSAAPYAGEQTREIKSLSPQHDAWVKPAGLSGNA